MRKPRICAVIVNNDPEAVKEVEPLVDLLEARIDLIGDGWQELVKQFKKPWIACNRSADEGGKWQGNEARRVEKLLDSSGFVSLPFPTLVGTSVTSYPWFPELLNQFLPVITDEVNPDLE